MNQSASACFEGKILLLCNLNQQEAQVIKDYPAPLSFYAAIVPPVQAIFLPILELPKVLLHAPLDVVLVYILDRKIAITLRLVHLRSRMPLRVLLAIEALRVPAF